jgi:RimJ/RimL family protein N-acetyltransferase
MSDASIGDDVVRLRPFRSGDELILAAWGRDDAFRRSAGWSEPLDDSHIRHHKNLIENPPPDQVRFGVETGTELIGTVDLYLGPAHGDYELGINIGPSGNWGRGYGRRAVQAAVRYAIEELGADRVWAQTHETNVRSQRLLGVAGFVEIGRDGIDDYDGVPTRLIQYEYRR